MAKRTHQQLTIPPEVMDRVVLLFVSGYSDATAATICAEKYDIPDKQIPLALAEAKRRITITADFNRDESVGQAIQRLDDLYRRSLTIQDAKTALAAQREKIKLLGLYAQPPDEPPPKTENSTDDRITAATSHLDQLDLAPPGTDLPELCRLAAAKILNQT